jgi:ribose 5-phosphate isomerase B
MADDYVPFMQAAALKVLEDIDHTKGIIIGGSGQGEAMAVNRFKGIRAAVYYGEPKRKQKDADGRELDILTSTIGHNNANVLSLGGRFLSEDEAKAAIEKWLSMTFSGAERHVRRIKMLDENL